MRHVPVADLQANAAELAAAVDGGDEVVITLGNRQYKLVSTGWPDHDEIVARRRQAFEDLAKIREELRSQGIRVTREEVREWIDEGRP